MTMKKNSEVNNWLESLVPEAVRILATLGSRKSRECIELGHYPIHEDYREVWRDLAAGTRAYLGLFFCVLRHRNVEALSYLTDNGALIHKIIRDLENSRKDYRRDIVSLSLARQARLIEKYRQEPERRRFPRWGPEDIPAEVFDIYGEPEMYKPKKMKGDIVRDIQGPASPVRQVSTEEYLATRRTPGQKGVSLEFDKENRLFQEWAKDSHKNSDQIYDGTEPEWYRSSHEEET